MSSDKDRFPDSEVSKRRLEAKMALVTALPWLGGDVGVDRAEYRRLGEQPLGDPTPRILPPEPASRRPRQSGARRHLRDAPSPSEESRVLVERVCASVPIALSMLRTVSVPSEVFERMREGGVGLPPDSPVFSILARCRMDESSPAGEPGPAGGGTASS